MTRAQIIYQFRRSGGGTVWIRRPRGGWRTITFDSGPTALAKIIGLASVLGRLSAATTVPLPGCLLTAQQIPGSEANYPAALPRPGPARQPAKTSGP